LQMYKSLVFKTKEALLFFRGPFHQKNMVLDKNYAIPDLHA